MNKLLASCIALSLIVGSAQAADLGVITQDAPAGYIASDWTGFYAGIFAGVGAGSNDISTSLGGFAGPSFSGNSGGALGGVQVGADYQMGNVVIGAVADIALTNIATNEDIGVGGGFGLGYDSTLNYLGTLRARIGFLPTDNLLAYVHGGLAYGQTDPNVDLGVGVGLDIDDVTRVGYTIGAGFEYKVTENISLQTEYAYTNLGSAAASYTPVGGFPAGADVEEDTDFHTVKAGVNFRF